MKKQAVNPYLPGFEYVPDGEPHVFEGRLYVYGSHDRFGGKKFCENDYVAWSAPIDNLSDWRYEGVIYKKTQDIDNADGRKAMYAPDVACGRDGRYYLYYGLADDTKIGVAVCDTPAGRYEFLDCVHDSRGARFGKRPQDFMPFDPGVLVDDDGRVYLYAGQGPMMKGLAKGAYRRHFRDSAYVVELDQDMVTMKSEPLRLLPNITDSEGTGFEGHEFFEANSIRKFDGSYYFIYSSVQSHELCYAVSSRPDRGFSYCGVLTSNGDAGLSSDIKSLGFLKVLGRNAYNYIGNNHGSLVRIGDSYYIFGHRHTSRSMFSRQGYAEQISYENGRFSYAELTSSGLNGGPLRGIGTYEARIACHLYSAKGPVWSVNRIIQNHRHPAFMQSGEDREKDSDQYIENLRNGATAGFRYFDFRTQRPSVLSVSVRGKADGAFYVYESAECKRELSVIRIRTEEWAGWELFQGRIDPPERSSGLYFVYRGVGYIDFRSFSLK